MIWRKKWQYGLRHRKLENNTFILTYFLYILILFADTTNALSFSKFSLLSHLMSLYIMCHLTWHLSPNIRWHTVTWYDILLSHFQCCHNDVTLCCFDCITAILHTWNCTFAIKVLKIRVVEDRMKALDQRNFWKIVCEN